MDGWMDGWTDGWLCLFPFPLSSRTPPQKQNQTHLRQYPQARKASRHPACPSSRTTLLCAPPQDGRRSADPPARRRTARSRSLGAARRALWATGVALLRASCSERTERSGRTQWWWWWWWPLHTGGVAGRALVQWLSEVGPMLAVPGCPPQVTCFARAGASIHLRMPSDDGPDYQRFLLEALLLQIFTWEGRNPRRAWSPFRKINANPSRQPSVRTRQAHSLQCHVAESARERALQAGLVLTDFLFSFVHGMVARAYAGQIVLASSSLFSFSTATGDSLSLFLFPTVPFPSIFNQLQAVK